MEKTIDLHTHSTYSDGSLSPTDLIDLACKANLSALALTDHDTIEGLAEAEAEADKQGIRFLPGLELSVRSETETHIVGLFIDRRNPVLTEALERARLFRTARSQKTAQKLRELGFDCSVDEAQALAGHANVGRGHFAKLMVMKGYAASINEAFRDFLAAGRPAYFGDQCFSDKEAISLIHAAGGIAIVAHLHLIRLPDDRLFAYLKELKEAGLDGIEGYYTDYSPEMERLYRGFAEKLGLLLSGGSDFHGAFKPHIALGKGLGGLSVPASLLPALEARAKAIRSASPVQGAKLNTEQEFTKPEQKIPNEAGAL